MIYTSITTVNQRWQTAPNHSYNSIPLFRASLQQLLQLFHRLLPAPGARKALQEPGAGVPAAVAVAASCRGVRATGFIPEDYRTCGVLVWSLFLEMKFNFWMWFIFRMDILTEFLVNHFLGVRFVGYHLPSKKCDELWKIPPVFKPGFLVIGWQRLIHFSSG